MHNLIRYARRKSNSISIRWLTTPCTIPRWCTTLFRRRSAIRFCDQLTSASSTLKQVRYSGLMLMGSGRSPMFLEANHSKCRSYLLISEADHKAAILDPLRDRIDRYLALLAYHGAKLELAIDTHTHADHRSGAGEL